jgi:hypothetical protein
VTATATITISTFPIPPQPPSAASGAGITTGVVSPTIRDASYGLKVLALLLIVPTPLGMFSVWPTFMAALEASPLASAMRYQSLLSP